MNADELSKIIDEIIEEEKFSIDYSIDEFRFPKPDLRARWKCMFGCEYYGKRKSCPPFVPGIDEAERFLKAYKLGFIIKVPFGQNYMATKIAVQRLLIRLEAKLLNSYPMIFTVFPGGCDLCDSCDPDSTCQARPTLSSLGINISDLGVKIGDKKLVGLILLE
ncbi:putative metal-binding protein [Archaeoglobus sulfaticallidus PM70-1]|uniref:Putative metal-binding protein n=1 Tax=Archaeoglobus sulfaticallidus PM70-1 TaxID=387631 RepID=N0BLL8_9EURY|nr:DUF2284 domain-containing protein [Archaeoglobus sulfaticallidus]AGK61110.1 putative metal-binding protein [Archaeoglobus sulfaticallidus PM70-1]